MALLSVAGLLYYAFVGPFLSKEEKQVRSAIKTAIDANATEIPLIGVLDVEWEHVCIVAPYINKREFKKTLGYDPVSYGAMDRWNNEEQYWTLAFVTKARNIVPIRILKVELGTYSLPRGEWMRCVPRDRAILQYDKRVNYDVPGVFTLIENVKR